MPRGKSSSRRPGFWPWFDQYGKYILSVQVAIAAIGLVVIAQGAVKPNIGNAEPRPIPTFGVQQPTETEQAATPLVRPTDRDIGVVFAGDSLTYGLFASAEEKGYRPQVVAALEKDGPVEWSRGGQTGNKIQAVSDSITFPATTDLVILELGTNDVWKTAQADIPAQYDALIAKAKASAPNVKIVCVGVWSDVDGRRNYDAPIQKSCESAGGAFLSLADIYDAEGTKGPAGKESFGGVSDNFHPNDTGYRAIADLILGELGVAR